MPEQMESYKCPSCGAPLRYTTTGKMTCTSCGNAYEIDAIESMLPESDGNGFDWGDYKKEFKQTQEKLEDRNVYICRSCGAAIETDDTTAATRCPYCDNEVLATDRMSGSLRPNGLIPFAIDKDEAVRAVKAHFHRKPLLPRSFLAAHRLGRIQGIYVPFWLFDADVQGGVDFDGTQVRHYSDNNYNYTETKHYLVQVSGGMRFSRIPVDGSEKMDDDLMDALEPFDYSGVKPFDAAYLSGFLADRFDEDPDKSLPRASDRMQAGAAAVMRGYADGNYVTLTPKRSHFDLRNTSVQYVLLPVYLLNLEFKNKKYRFAVNGQTGKVVGELPVSKAISRLWFGGVAAGVTALGTFLTYLLLR